MISTDKKEGKKKKSCLVPDTLQASQEAATNVDTKHKVQKLPTHVTLQIWVKAELDFDSGLDPLSIPCLSEKRPVQHFCANRGDLVRALISASWLHK